MNAVLVVQTGVDMQGSAKIVRLASLLLVIELFTPVVSGSTQLCVNNKIGYGNNVTLYCQFEDDDLVKESITDGAEYGSDCSIRVFSCTHFDDYSPGRDNVLCDAACLSSQGIFNLNGQSGYWEFIYYWLN
ncbi:hypothetical protein E2542_SST01691 [Spatholobus suberectus]|nr:hypothetical protein E2542_SST01691 [Spatholobus suberectus]